MQPAFSPGSERGRNSVKRRNEAMAKNGRKQAAEAAAKKRAKKPSKKASKPSKKPLSPQGRGESSAEASAEAAKVLASYGGTPHRPAAKKMPVAPRKKGAKKSK